MAGERKKRTERPPVDQDQPCAFSCVRREIPRHSATPFVFIQDRRDQRVGEKQQQLGGEAAETANARGQWRISTGGEDSARTPRQRVRFKRAPTYWTGPTGNQAR